MKSVVLLAFAVLASPSWGQDHAADLRALTRNVTGIGVAGVPGPLCVFGPHAFPVVLGSAGKSRACLAAASRMGKGRVVAFGHNGYLNPRVDGMDTMIVNAVAWACGGQPKHVAVLRNSPLRRHLASNGYQVTNLDLESLPASGVLVLDAARLRKPRQIQAVQRFLRAGGGLVTASLGWGWLQLNPMRELATDHPGNLLLLSAGLAWLDGTLRPGPKRLFPVLPTIDPLVQASRALEVLAAHPRRTPVLSKDQLRQAQHTLVAACRGLPPQEPMLRAKLHQLLEKGRNERRLPGKKTPLGTRHLLDRLRLILELERSKRLPADKVAAHPAARNFPGPVPAEAPRGQATIEFDMAVPGWHSAGLYAAPGEIVTVSLPAGADALGLKLRIGAHKDRTWNKERWTRAPEITRVWPLDAPESTTACAFGGLVYLVVPNGAPARKLSVTIGGVVRAPLFRLGVTTLDEWRNRVREAPAPWAEIGSRKLMVTVPSQVVRTLADPGAVARAWDRIIDLNAELAGRSSAAARPERIVADMQISAGYMHSGYPIMTHMDQTKNLVDVAHLRKGNWGLFHELGHNHQSRDWTFGGTGEVTVNLFTLYVFENFCSVDIHETSRMSRSRRRVLMRGWDFRNPEHERWKRSPFLALVMYMQIQDEFGWDPFKKVFAEYLALPRKERPRTDQQKRDQWLVRLSQATGRNLGPFFELWGVPTSAQARTRVQDLPVWNCAEIKPD